MTALVGWQSSSHLYEHDFTLPIVIETSRCIFFKLALIWMQIQQNYMLLGFWNLQAFFPWDLYLNTFQSYWQSWERFAVRQSSLVTRLPDPTSLTVMLPCTFGKLVLKCKKKKKKCCSLKAKQSKRKGKKLIFVWNDWHFPRLLHGKRIECYENSCLCFCRVVFYNQVKQVLF